MEVDEKLNHHFNVFHEAPEYERKGELEGIELFEFENEEENLEK